MRTVVFRDLLNQPRTKVEQWATLVRVPIIRRACAENLCQTGNTDGTGLYREFVIEHCE